MKLFTKKNLTIAVLVIAALVFCISKLGYFDKASQPVEDLAIYFLDVGQGDCEVIRFSDGRNILIDAGPNSTQDELVKKLKAYGIKKFDVVVATHPHEDHIGGMDEVIENFEIGCVYMPDITANSKTFEKLLDAIEHKNIKVKKAKAGVSVINEESINMMFVAPNSDDYEDLNNYSAVLKLTYGDCSFLFTGDAEVLSEREILEEGYLISADVLKAGHHGSSTSSSLDFINEVNPRFVVIEVGEDNEYGHPHSEVLESFKEKDVYRTDIHGDITLTCDGVNIKITTEDGD